MKRTHSANGSHGAPFRPPRFATCRDGPSPLSESTHCCDSALTPGRRVAQAVFSSKSTTGTQDASDRISPGASHAFWPDRVPLVESRSPARRECRLETSRRREIIDWRDCRTFPIHTKRDAPDFPGRLQAPEDRLPLPVRRRRPIGPRTVANMLNPYKLLPRIAGCDTRPSPSFLCFAFFLLVRGPDLPQSTV